MAEGGIMTETKEQSILDELAHSETVRKLIECPVCLDLPLPPIYVCNKGHIVCNNCQARTYACPLCREHYSTTRGFVAEGIIEKCILRCKHSDQGCPLSMRGSELVEHLEVCDYRPVKCVDCAGKLINFEEYEDHLLKHHRINGIAQNRAYVIYSMNLAHQIAFGEKCCWPQYYLKAFDNVTFLLRLYATHWFVCAWVSLLGPKSDCTKYEALLEFHPTNDDSVVHTWAGPVNHFRADPAKEIFLQGRGLITPMETLMQMAPVANEHAEWLYNIEILRVSDQNDSEESSLPQEENENATETATEGEGSVTETTEKPGEEVASHPKTPDPSSAPSSGSQRKLIGGVNSDAMAKSPPPARIVCEAPQNAASTIGSSFRTPRRGTSNSQFATVLTPRPATLSPSTSVLAAATVTPSGSSSMMEASTQSTTSSADGMSSFSSFRNESSQGAVTVSTARPSTRLLSSLRRTSPSTLAFLLRSDNRNFGMAEDDWDYSSDNTDEE